MREREKRLLVCIRYSKTSNSQCKIVLEENTPTMQYVFVYVCVCVCVCLCAYICFEKCKEHSKKYKKVIISKIFT